MEENEVLSVDGSGSSVLPERIVVVRCSVSFSPAAVAVAAAAASFSVVLSSSSSSPSPASAEPSSCSVFFSFFFVFFCCCFRVVRFLLLCRDRPTSLASTPPASSIMSSVVCSISWSRFFVVESICRR